MNEKRVDLATPLLVAIINGHEDLVDLLLEKGADPNDEGGSTDLSVQGSRARPIRITLKTPSYRDQLRDVGTEGGNGANNSWGRPLQAAIHVANWHISDEFISVNIDRMRVIKSLLKHGADVNARNTDMEPRWSGARYRRRQVGLTPFLAAARQADIEVMRLLLEHGADPKMNTPLNITPLMLAAGIAWASNQDRASEEQVLEAVKMLVEELGADVNFVADTGETGDARGRVSRREQRRAVSLRQRREARRAGQERTNAPAGRRRCRVRKFVRGESAHRGAAAQARREGNSVSGFVPERHSGRSVAT